MKLSSAICALLTVATQASAALIPRAEDSKPDGEPTDPVLLLSKDESFHFELLATLALSVYGQGDINDILGAAKNVKAGNFTNWLKVFQTLAEDTKKQSEDPEYAYDAVNVRDAHFAASSYWRQAEFYNHQNWTDPRIRTFWDEQRAAFDKGLAALPVPGERIQIPVDGFSIEAIWYTPARDGARRPTMIIGNGYDAAQEDSYSSFVVPALTRGWNVITYEGPGQPSVRRDSDIGFISDWERVLTPVVDHLLSKKGCLVDHDRLTLVGISMGGYLAARAAAFEPRIKALIVNGGVYDVYAGYAANLGPELNEILDSGDQEQFDKIALGLLDDIHIPTTLRWGLGHGLWSFKQKSPFEWLQELKKFTLEGIIDKIKVPVLVIDSQFEGFFAGQPEIVAKALGDRATYHLFNGTAGYHVQVGAYQEWNRFQFAWLNKTLG
jgi:pimeloyl-ACP methyl ester carboxylesterase